MIPTRLCCGQKHWNIECPDGLVMCCICFKRFETYKLNQISNCQYEDVCKECAKQ